MEGNEYTVHAKKKPMVNSYVNLSISALVPFPV